MKNEEFVDDVLRKVGRNVLLFQQLEQLLKFIIANRSLAGVASEIQELRKEQEIRVNKHTMGTLVGQYAENLSPKLEVSSQEHEQLDEAYLSLSFSVGYGDNHSQNQKEALAQLVTERNDLIHHLLPRFKADSAESCKSLGQELDVQSEKIRLEIKSAQSVAQDLHKGREYLVDYLQSEKCRKVLELSFLRQSRLVLMLADIATQISRKDGWALISSAGNFVKRHAPEALENMRERYGYSSLKQIIQASELFDLHEEVLPKGGTRDLYRLKSG